LGEQIFAINIIEYQKRSLKSRKTGDKTMAMRCYYGSVEKKKGDEYRKVLDKYVEWYREQHENYNKLLQSRMVEKFSEVYHHRTNTLSVEFDTNKDPFDVAEHLCKHILSTFSEGPDDPENALNLKKRGVSWLDSTFRPSIIDLTQILQDYFNNNHVGEEIDLTVVFEDRKDRDDLVHKGMFDESMSLIRLFNVIRCMLIFMNDYYVQFLPRFTYPTYSINFDFQKFWRLFDFDDFKNRTTILIVGSLHDISKNQLSILANLPWSIVIDFDANTNFGGLRSTVEQEKTIHDQLLTNTNYKAILKNMAMSQNVTEWITCGEFLIINPKEQLMNYFASKQAFYNGVDFKKCSYFLENFFT